MNLRTEKTGRFRSGEALNVDAFKSDFWHDSEGHLGVLSSLTACGEEMSGPKDFVALFQISGLRRSGPMT